MTAKQLLVRGVAIAALLVLAIFLAGLILDQEDPTPHAGPIDAYEGVNVVNIEDHAGNFGNAMAATPSGGTLYIPAGTYTSGPVTRDTPINIVGDGSGVSKIVFTGTNGLVFNMGSHGENVAIRDLALLTQNAHSGKAVSVDYPFVSSTDHRDLLMDNVTIQGVDQTADYWTQAVWMEDTWHARLLNLTIRGQSGTRHMDEAIYFSGQSVDPYLDDVNIRFAETGVFIGGSGTDGNQVEGLMAENFYCVWCGWGIKTDNLVNEPLLRVDGGHISSFLGGVFLKNRISSEVSGVLFFKHVNSTTAWRGVRVEGGYGTRIHDNEFHEQEGSVGASTAVEVPNHIRIDVHDNGFDNMDTGVYLTSNADYSNVQDNWGQVNGAIVIDSGQDNVVRNNVKTPT